MADRPTHRQFFGDREYAFALAPELITELERVTGRGIGGLCRAVFAGDFRHHEISATIRLALIGGGVAPEDAQGLVATYVPALPLAESYALAVAILESVWFGSAAPTPKKRGRRK